MAEGEIHQGIIAVCAAQSYADFEVLFKSGKPLVYIKAVILTTDERHQRMLIGQGARKIKDIGSFARKELEVAMNKKVFLDLDVLVDDEWMDRLS